MYLPYTGYTQADIEQVYEKLRPLYETWLAEDEVQRKYGRWDFREYVTAPDFYNASKQENDLLLAMAEHYADIHYYVVRGGYTIYSAYNLVNEITREFMGRTKPLHWAMSKWENDCFEKDVDAFFADIEDRKHK